MEAVLVSGGAGYVGCHACKALFLAGFLPVTYDNLSTGHAYSVKWGPLVVGDLRDQKLLRETIQKYRPTAVLHFAADSILFESMQNPLKYYKNNIASTLSLLEVMLEYQIKRLVFSSTCATYGNPQFLPMTEEHPQSPISPYGRSKWMVEKILKDFEGAYGLSYASLRYFNAAGADLDGEVGENHAIETHLIPIILSIALGQKEGLDIYGTNFPTEDGTAIRDYIHVQDLADAHVLALKWLMTHQKSLSVNLGTGKGHSILQVIQAIEQHTKKKIPVRKLSKREGEPPVLTADNKLAFKTLGWSPRLDLKTMIESAWRWHRILLEQDVSKNSILTTPRGAL